MTTGLSPELLDALRPAPDSSLTRVRQLYLGLYDAIVSGRLPHGARLPAVRELAPQLGVGRNLVVEVYAQLGAEGLLHGDRRRGTRVSFSAPPVQGRTARRNASAWTTSKRASGLASRAQHHPDLAPGEPDCALFPAAAWRRALSRASTLGADDLRYRTRPLPQLQAAIARFLASHRSLTVAPERIVVTSSTRQSLMVAASLFADAGDAAWMETPGYLGAVDAFRQLGLALEPCPVDGAGLRLPARRPAPRLIYLTPGFQFPTGVALGAERREALLALSAQAGTVIFEDDYDSEFRDSTQPRPALAAAAGDARVLHAGTFSKLLFPAARVAWLVVPEPHVDGANRCLRALGGGHATHAQAAVAELLDSGAIVRHLQRARAVYARRRDALNAALSALPQVAEPARHDGALNQVVPLVRPLDRTAVEDALARHRIGAVTLERLRWDRPRVRTCRALVLGLGNVDQLALPDAVERLGAALGEAAAAPG